MKQVDHLLTVLPQALDVVFDIAQFEHLHTALDAAQEGAFLVAGEIVPELVAQDLVDRLARIGNPVAPASAVAHRQRAQTLDIFDQLPGHVLDGKLQIDRARGHRVVRHIRVARRGVIGLLRDRQPAFFLDCPGAERAVVPGAGQDHRDRVLAAILGERGEKDVDRVVFVAMGRLPQVQLAAAQGRHRVGHQHIDAICLDRLAVSRREDRQVCGPAQDLRQRALIALAEMRHDDKRHAGFRRHRRKKRLQRLDPAGRRANADDGKMIIGGPGASRHMPQTGLKPATPQRLCPPIARPLDNVHGRPANRTSGIILRYGARPRSGRQSRTTTPFRLCCARARSPSRGRCHVPR